MSPRLPSASRLHLAYACAASQALPQVASVSAAADAGTEKHRALSARLGEGVVASPDYSKETQAWLNSLDDEVLAPLAGARSEPAYAYDWATGKARCLGAHLERAYPETAPTEYVGSADYLSVTGETVTVVDLKTGAADVPHPSRNAQLRFLALAAARTHGVSSARVGILQAPDGRQSWWTWAGLDAFELEVVAGELRTLAEHIAAASKAVAASKMPRLTVGEHCTHCPARHGCPARVAMAQRLAGEPEKVVSDLKAMLTPETAGRALARWRAARKALDEVGAALHAYAKESPIPLGDGRVWGPRTREREIIDAELAWPVLVAAYGADVARKAMSLDTSKAGIERAMRALRETMIDKPTLKALNAQALEALKLAGAITMKTTTVFEEYALEIHPGTEGAREAESNQHNQGETP